MLLQNCSLYLNAEPLPSERVHPLTVSSNRTIAEIAQQGVGADVSVTESAQEGSAQPPATRKEQAEWHREGVYRFIFAIHAPNNRNAPIASKEAPAYSFSSAAQNWGWSGFCPRDRVYFNNPSVKEADTMIISVTLTYEATSPKSHRSKAVSVPKTLVSSFADMVDDPEHSDVVFHLTGKRVVSEGIARWPGGATVYAFRKILMARSEYFYHLLGDDFAEGENPSDDDSDDEQQRRASRRGTSVSAGAAGAAAAAPDQDAMHLDEPQLDGGRSASALTMRRGTQPSHASPMQMQEDEDWDLEDDGDDFFADSDAEYTATEDEGEDEDQRFGTIPAARLQSLDAPLAIAQGERNAPSQASDDEAPPKQVLAHDTPSKTAATDTAKATGWVDEHGSDEEAAHDEIAALSRGINPAGAQGTPKKGKQRESSETLSEGLAGQFNAMSTVKNTRKRGTDATDSPSARKAAKRKQRSKHRKIVSEPRVRRRTAGLPFPSSAGGPRQLLLHVLRADLLPLH